MAHSIADIREILFGRGPESDESDEADADDAFVPSEMDLSVRVGHGGQEDELAREIATIRERAEEIEERESV
jgi:hypothetical protein